MKTWANVNALYQIYPRSFKDTNNDGVGDLKGIAEKIDYLRGKHHALGVDAIWISPFYPSPMADFGYDVSDYNNIHPMFGSLEEFKAMLDMAHSKNLKVVIDLVPNHSSDQHPWFQDALKNGKTSKYRDYYIWKDPKPDGSVPNNWVSIFGGSMWQWEETSGQYYLHTFLKEQPDLNWENPAVREEMKQTVRFWLDMGVDGFRVDAVNHLGKDTQFRDEPPNPDYDGPAGTYESCIRCYSKLMPNMHEYLRELTDIVEGYPDKMMFYELAPDSSVGVLAEQFYAMYDINARVGIPFNFGGMYLPWGAKPMGDYIRDFQEMLRTGDRPAYCFSNHDQPRIVSRFGRRQARLIAMLLLTLPGIPAIYYGDEIGMADVPIPPEKRQDPATGDNVMGGRDPERTPMQWNAKKNAGFSEQQPWLPVPRKYLWHNLAVQMQNKNSFFHLYRKLLRLRDANETMIKGEFREIANDGRRNVLIYERLHGDGHYMIALNFSRWYRPVKLAKGSSIVCFTQPGRKPVMAQGEVVLGPYEGVVVAL